MTWDNISDVFEGMPPKHLIQLKGIMEQMICANSRVFVGTPLSTFTAYAQRMRIYNDAPQKERLSHTSIPSEEQAARITAELQAWDTKGGASAFKPADPSLASLEWVLGVP